MPQRSRRSSVTVIVRVAARPNTQPNISGLRPLVRTMTGLLERDDLLAALNSALEAAARGAGATALVSGEAGVGKTTLLEHFARDAGPGRVLWGGCEALSTPHPLGPLHDLANGAGEALRSMLSARSDRPALFAAVFDELSRSPLPVVIVLEDLHWADAA